MRTLDAINNKIRQQTVAVETAEAFKARAADEGIAQAYRAVDVVTTGTFEPMEASGAIINLGQTDPPIKIRDCQLDGVAAYAGFGAVDLYLGASQPAATVTPEEESSRERGGGYVIADLVAGKSVQLQASG
ncbi:MAG: homocysteine biosynthesis protein, partial [Cyanobacteria bacterium J06559_3]